MRDPVSNSMELPKPVAARLRALTPARVGLGRTGVSQQTADVLAFQLAHAQARDAVHARMDSNSVAAAIRSAAEGMRGVDVIRVHSAAPDRVTYLQRPDLGRRLDSSSHDAVIALRSVASDLAIIAADGLSALAVERHAGPLLRQLFSLLPDLRLAPVCVVEQGRVAIGDEVGSLLSAAISLVLIGERPGLSSPDSLGAYITWGPRVGRTDAERNCISNIRAEGLGYADAAAQIATCIRAARRCRITGVGLARLPTPLSSGASGGDS